VPHVLFPAAPAASFRDSLTEEAAETLVSAFISSRLDYCNSLLDRVQRLQNAAARLVTGTSKYDHITPVLSALHWLPVRQRIVYKVALLMYKCVHGLAPPYLVEDCVKLLSMPVHAHLRSAMEPEGFRSVQTIDETSTGQRAFELFCSF